MTDQPARGGPEKCPRPCSVCEGDDHHWGYHDFSESEPEHPAAKAGHEVWDGCKHCDAWREVPDEEDDEPAYPDGAPDGYPEDGGPLIDEAAAPAVAPKVCPDCKGNPLTPIDRNGKRYLCQTCKGNPPE